MFWLYTNIIRCEKIFKNIPGKLKDSLGDSLTLSNRKSKKTHQMRLTTKSPYNLLSHLESEVKLRPIIQ